jgi:pimeloyl-ACP methyl ester carboxylesterase
VAITLVIMTAACNREIGDRQLLFPRKHALQDEVPGRGNLAIDLPNGDTLRGWHLHQEARTDTILYWYGNGETVLTSVYRLEWLARELDCNVVAVDYRGYGFSDGTATVGAVLSDALIVYDYARDELGVTRPLLFGRSLGTAPAVMVAGERPVRGLILEAPFPSLEAVLQAWQAALPVPFRWIMRLKPADELAAFDRQPVDVMADYTGPLLVLHGEQDQTIPPSLGRAMFDAAGSTDKRWCAVPDTDHNNLLVSNPVVAEALKGFVKRPKAP